MPSTSEHSRINLADLKSQIARKLGPEWAPRYFGSLNMLLAQKLSKSEFNKFCLSALGREFIPLHNQLIRSILKNACHAKIPPSPMVGKKPPQEDNGLVWPNGDILPPSPRKSRSGIRDRRIKDRPSPLGPNGRADATPPQSFGASENGVLSPCHLKRLVQHHQDKPAEQPRKRLRAESIEELERKDDLHYSRQPLRAPLGIPFCQASVGGARRSATFATSSSSYDSGELCHTEALRNRMERIAEAQGLGGVTIDCANLLNNGLDAYLKRLINSCVELVGARSGHQPIKPLVQKQQPHGKPINGALPGSHIHVQSSSRSLGGSQRPISLQDFKVAMELNPQQLGEDWPLLLEKICFRSLEE